MLSSLSSAGDLPEIRRTAESTPVSKSIKVPTTSKVRTLKLLNEAVDDIFWLLLSVGQGLGSVPHPGHDDGVLGMKGHGETAAERRDAAVGLMIARLAQAEPDAIGERQEDAEALALIDDVGDRAGEPIAAAAPRAVVDQQLFAVHGEHQRVPVGRGAGAAQKDIAERSSSGVDARHGKHRGMVTETREEASR